jgi:Uma2 family endonuclease
MQPARQPPPVPPLRPGQRLTQPEFHRRYEAYPEDVKFELVGGVVYMASPQKRQHGLHQPPLSLVLSFYAAATPGTEVLINSTTILGEESEPQPDLTMRILRAFGGQSRENEQDYVEGAPELVAEVADTTRAFDLNQKRDDYRRAGVGEYLVLSVAEPELHWFNFKLRRAITPNRQGVARSRVFPGLWIAVPALLARNLPRLLEVVQQGLGSREHAAFVKRLAAARRKHT